MHMLTFKFADDVAMQEVKQTLSLALIALEALVGETRVFLADCHALDVANRACWIDESDDVGRSLGAILAALLLREFGEDRVSIARRSARVAGRLRGDL